MRFVGLDLSLTGTGVAILRLEADRWSPPELHTLRHPNGKAKVTLAYKTQRLVAILAELKALDISGAQLVAIEDYAYGVNIHETNCTFTLGELGGLVRVWLATDRTPFVAVPIQSGKKFATGNGSAKKDQVARAMANQWQLPEFHKRDYDKSDALALATLAAFKRLGNLPGLKTYRFQSALVAKIEEVS